MIPRSFGTTPSASSSYVFPFFYSFLSFVSQNHAHVIKPSFRSALSTIACDPMLRILLCMDAREMGYHRDAATDEP